MRSGRGEGGQATVELALALPLLSVLALLLLQVALVVRDQVLLVHAAREAARAVAVDAEGGVARRAALAGARLDGDALEVDLVRSEGDDIRTVRLRYRSATRVPVVGRLVGDVRLVASAAMRAESG